MAEKSVYMIQYRETDGQPAGFDHLETYCSLQTPLSLVLWKEHSEWTKTIPKKERGDTPRSTTKHFIDWLVAKYPKKVKVLSYGGEHFICN